MLETFLNLSSTNSNPNDLYKNISGVFKGEQKQQYLEQITNSIKRLSDNILYAPNMQMVQNVTKKPQQQIADLKEVKACLEPIQQALGDEIFSLAMILTPDKMQNILAKNPWEVLIDIRPVNLATPPNNPDLVPIVFHHGGVQYIGWQMRKTLPILFDCQLDEPRILPTLTPALTPEMKSPPKTGEEFEFEVITIDAKGEITNRRHHKATQQIEQINHINIEMVYIPGGTFMMGSPEDEGEKNEKPQHQVTIQPFYMGKYPVTQAQWQAIMGDNISYFKGKNKPVEKVSWNNAIAFCQKLSVLTDKTYRLPSEAEWEYACRAGTTTPFYFGETITSDLANYYAKKTYASEPKGFYREKTTDVGEFPPNAFGLYDMHGNVWEWCADKYHESYKGSPNDGSVWEKGGESNRTLRGGSLSVNPNYNRVAYRIRLAPVYRYNSIGFRVFTIKFQ